MIALRKPTLFTSMMILGSCFNPMAAQEASPDIAFVENVAGRAVAFVSGRPTLLGPLDVITNQTRVDVLANSELRLCHYQASRFFDGPRTRSDHRFRGRSKRRSGQGACLQRDLWRGRSISASGRPSCAGVTRGSQSRSARLAIRRWLCARQCSRVGAGRCTGFRSAP
jgi:hypothetical protein